MKTSHHFLAAHEDAADVVLESYVLRLFNVGIHRLLQHRGLSGIWFVELGVAGDFIVICIDRITVRLSQQQQQGMNIWVSYWNEDIVGSELVTPQGSRRFHWVVAFRTEGTDCTPPDIPCTVQDLGNVQDLGDVQEFGKL